jgi:hypothetical protein
MMIDADQVGFERKRVPTPPCAVARCRGGVMRGKRKAGGPPPRQGGFTLTTAGSADTKVITGVRFADGVELRDDSPAQAISAAA